MAGSGTHRPASSAAILAHAREVLGPDALDWAVDLGHAIASTIIAEIPAFGGGDDPFETLRMGTESAAVRAMILLVTNDPTNIGVGEESLEGDRDFVRRGIPLDKVLRGIRIGLAMIARAVLDAATALPRLALPRYLAYPSCCSTSSMISRPACQTSTWPRAEHDRWVTSAAADRAALVRRILDGGEIDQDDASSGPTSQCIAITAPWSSGRTTPRRPPGPTCNEPRLGCCAPADTAHCSSSRTAPDPSGRGHHGVRRTLRGPSSCYPPKQASRSRLAASATESMASASHTARRPRPPSWFAPPRSLAVRRTVRSPGTPRSSSPSS